MCRHQPLVKHTVTILVVLLAVFIYYIPSPIDPDPYRFEKAPPRLVGTLQPNRRLARLGRLHGGLIIGPESFTADSYGNIYTGTADGQIWKFNTTHARSLARVGANLTDCGTFEKEPLCGRPKGVGVHPLSGQLYFLDAYFGLHRIDPENGHVERVLSNVMDGVSSHFYNGLTISSLGDIYFTDSSSRWDRRNYRYEVIELNHLGRVLHYDPTSGRLKTLLSGLCLANGIALSTDESFLVFAEMSICRLSKFYLKGPKAGQMETFYDNLPGYPDNIKLSSRGTFYVGLASVRYEGSSPIGSFLDIIAPYPALKRFIAKVTPWGAYNLFLPRHAILLEFNENGEVENSFHDPDGDTIRTGLGDAFEHRGAIYTGHFERPFVGYIKTEDLYKD